jgi:hypothetical protein|tara:strand:+ start:367 stop:555 length:189 start_codon:yes stop_codon:yes gene_type:complete
MDIMKIFDNEIVKTLAHIIGVILFLYFVFGLMAVSGRGLVKAAENNYEKIDLINEMNELNKM